MKNKINIFKVVAVIIIAIIAVVIIATGFGSFEWMERVFDPNSVK